VVAAQAAVKDVPSGAFCGRCGAWRGDLGLEPTPELYIEHMVSIFQEVRRVLTNDGTLWLNMGDCYATGGGKVGEHPGGGEQGARWKGDVNQPRDAKRDYRGERLANGRGDQPAILRKKTRATRDGTHAGKHTTITAMGPMTQPNRMPIAGLKPKDLVMMPARLALALQADGWWLRRDIIWSKPNPMPESTRDRPTTAHEYLFILTRSGRTQFWVHRELGLAQRSYSKPEPDYRWIHRKTDEESVTQVQGAQWRRVNLWRGSDYYYDAAAIAEPLQSGRSDLRKMQEGLDRITPNEGDELYAANPNGRGIPWEDNGAGRNARSVWTIATEPYADAHFATFPKELARRCILAGSAPGDTVLDPFGGSGTTAAVAVGHGRAAIHIDLSPAYLELARQRVGPMLCEVG
jgi:DNA modification methylase